MTDDIKHQCPPGWMAVPVSEIKALWGERHLRCTEHCHCSTCIAEEAIIARLPKPPAWTEEDVWTVSRALHSELHRDIAWGTAEAVLTALAEAGRLKPVEEEQ